MYTCFSRFGLALAGLCSELGRSGAGGELVLRMGRGGVGAGWRMVVMCARAAG
jgi:hypothetical protein